MELDDKKYDKLIHDPVYIAYEIDKLLKALTKIQSIADKIKRKSIGLRMSLLDSVKEINGEFLGNPHEKS